jgi:DNA-binding protein YbaB
MEVYVAEMRHDIDNLNDLNRRAMQHAVNNLNELNRQAMEHTGEQHVRPWTKSTSLTAAAGRL